VEVQMKLRVLTMVMAIAFATGGIELPMLSVGTAVAMDWLTPHLESQRYNNNLRRRQQQMQRKGTARYQPGQPAITHGPDPARRRQLMRQIEPEYRRRVQLYGKGSADRWLQRTAWRLGVEEGRRARRRAQNQ
jgi:hypothetical protein